MLQCSRPRTSDTVLAGLSNSCWTIFLGSSLRSLPFDLVSRCVAQQLDSNSSVDLPRGPNSVVAYICISQLESLTLLTADVSKDYILLHVNDSIQVIFAARFIWRQHSNMTTLLFHRKTCDVVFLKNYVILCTLVILLEY